MSARKHLLVLSSPSGGGKSTVARHLLNKFPKLKFSVSATTRKQRPKEKNGKDYFFLTKEEFQQKIKNNELVEYEKIFGNFYGTLKSEIDNALKTGYSLIFDIDVKGALSLKKVYPDESLLIFISPPSINVLKERLNKRGTESYEEIALRISRAKMEMELREKFDFDIINEALEDTLKISEKIVKRYLSL
jgi:guanylate kinase